MHFIFTVLNDKVPTADDPVNINGSCAVGVVSVLTGTACNLFICMVVYPTLVQEGAGYHSELKLAGQQQCWVIGLGSK